VEGGFRALPKRILNFSKGKNNDVISWDMDTNTTGHTITSSLKLIQLNDVFPFDKFIYCEIESEAL
jgi:23S rRNA U2552 (ribose-2'-O)-methylase RlmE/FtsJ